MLVAECPPFPQGGSEAIAGWLERNPDARMVVIDVFAKMRGQDPQGVSAYDADYVSVGYAKRLADHYGIAVVLVHHVRKAGSDDFLTEGSGTNGIAGAADATLVLKRARRQADGILHVTGRDVDEAEYALQFQAASGAWQMLDGPVTDHTIGDTRAAILRHVREHPGIRPRDIVAALPDIDADTVRRYCSRMAEAGQLTKDAAGRYYPDTPPQDVSEVSDCPVIPADLHEGTGHPETPSVRLSDSRTPRGVRSDDGPAQVTRRQAHARRDLQGPEDLALHLLRLAREGGRAPRCIKLPNGDLRIRRSDYEHWLDGREDSA